MMLMMMMMLTPSPELELEKEAREEAEAHAALLTEERELEGRRLKELEVIRQELEEMLEEELQIVKSELILLESKMRSFDATANDRGDSMCGNDDVGVHKRVKIIA